MAQFGNTTVNGELQVAYNVNVQGEVSVNNVTFSSIVNEMATKISKSKISHLFTGDQYDVSWTNTADTDWTISSATAVRAGSILRIYFLAKRSTETGVGNITNENIGAFTITHNGTISKLYNGTGSTYSTGQVTMFYSTNPVVNDTDLTVDLMISATHAALQTVYGMVILPVGVNVDAL